MEKEGMSVQPPPPRAFTETDSGCRVPPPLESEEGGGGSGVPPSWSFSEQK